MKLRSAVLFAGFWVTLVSCSVALGSSIDPTARIGSGGHSTGVFGTSFGPFFPFATVPGADCVVDPPTIGDAFCNFNNENSEGLTFNTIALTITGEVFGPLNPLTCFNDINPDSEEGGGCLVTNNTIRFFGLGIPATDPTPPSEFFFTFQNTFVHTIGAGFLASPTNSVPEPASALLVGSGIAAVLALSRRRNLRRSKT